MKKTVKKLIADVLIITTLISIFALAGCGVKNSDNANADVQDGVTFTDALGRSVTVKSADRTASLLGSFSDVWLLAGGKLVASVNDAWDSLDLGLDDSVVNPEGKIKVVELNDNNIGRDASELLRKVEAAQFVASHDGEVCPAKWKKGESTLKPSIDLVGKI